MNSLVNSRRILLGFAAMIAVGAIISFVPLPRFTAGIELLMSGLSTFVAALAGAIVARRSFLLPAISFVFVVWLFLIYQLYRIALPAGPASLTDIALSNVSGLFVWVAAAAFGVWLGHWYVSQGSKPANTAT